MTNWCEDFVSPHSHGASLVYTVVSLHTRQSYQEKFSLLPCSTILM